MGNQRTRRTFMKEASTSAAALAALSASRAGAADGPGSGTPFLCVTCGTQFAESAQPAGALPDLRGRAAVRQPRRPAVDDAREALRATHKNIDQEGGRAALLDQHRAEVRHRPAGVPDPDAEGQRPVGLRRADRRRDGRADQGAGRDRRDRDLAPALLHVDGGVEPGLRRRADPHPRGRAPLGDAARPVRPVLEGRGARRCSAACRWSAPAATSRATRSCSGRRAPAARGALMAGDQPQICMDPKQVSFMWSYPNYIPLNAPTIRHVVDCLDPLQLRPDLRRVLRPRQGDRPDAGQGDRPPLGRPLPAGHPGLTPRA